MAHFVNRTPSSCGHDFSYILAKKDKSSQASLIKFIHTLIGDWTPPQESEKTAGVDHDAQCSNILILRRLVVPEIYVRPEA